MERLIKITWKDENGHVRYARKHNKVAHFPNISTAQRWIRNNKHAHIMKHDKAWIIENGKVVRTVEV